MASSAMVLPTFCIAGRLNNMSTKAHSEKSSAMRQTALTHYFACGLGGATVVVA